MRHRNCKLFFGCNKVHSWFNWNLLMFGVGSKTFDQIPVYVRLDLVHCEYLIK